MASVIRFPNRSAFPPPKRQNSARPPRIALSLAGGGPLGAIYEIGALCALQEVLDGIDFTKLDHYIGVSAGSFIAASLANGMSPQELCASFIDNDVEDADAEQLSDRFDPAWLMRPAFGEFTRRLIMLPGLLAQALWQASVQRKRCPPGFSPAQRSMRVWPRFFRSRGVAMISVRYKRCAALA
jgi:Patatin-like phospholipase